MTVAFLERRQPLPAPAVRRVVRAVLDGEGAGGVAVSVSFVRVQQMRALNRRSFGRDRATDVITFRLPHDGLVTGDIYICASRARVAARALGIPEREELIRLVIHGTLHVLGQDHPDGPGRVRSSMWRRQERYVGRLAGTP